MATTNISRRSFVKATAIGGLALAAASNSLGGLVPKAEAAETEPEERIVKTCCKGCVADCGVLAHVKNGRVVKIEGDPTHFASQGYLCPKSLSAIQMLYNPNRVKYPMRRVGARGENKWERITWDEALTELATNLKEAEEKYGGEALIVGHGGGGHAYYSETAKRFCHVFGSPNIFEPGGLQCYEPRVVAYRMVWGGRPTDPVSMNYTEVMNQPETEAIVLWGTNPAGSSVGTIGRAVAKLRKNGVKTVVIDPRLTPDASKADVWLPIRPKTDVALMFCWMKYIIDNDVFDHELVTKWTTLPFLVDTATGMCLRPSDIGLEDDPDGTTRVVWDKNTDSAQLLPYPWDDAIDPELFGEYEVNGLHCKTGFQLLKERADEWPIERAAEVCWLDPESIQKAIDIYVEASPHSGVCTGIGAGDHNEFSVQAGLAAAILECMMGNCFVPGSMLQDFGSKNNLSEYDREMALSSINGAGGGNPYYGDPGNLRWFMPYEQIIKKFGHIEHKGSCYGLWSHNHTLMNAMESDQPYRPHVYIEESNNKMANIPNQMRWRKVLDKTEYIVHHVVCPTSFSMYADLLLPATEWLESNWTVMMGNNVYVRQQTTHLWEDIEEPAFWGMLANKLGDLGMEKFVITCDPNKIDEFEPYEGFTGQKAPHEFPWWKSQIELLENNFKLNGGTMNWPEFVKYVEDNDCYKFMDDETFYGYEPHKIIDESTGKPFGFSTPSKKLELYCDAMITFGRTGAPYSFYNLPPASKDYDPLPYWYETENSPYNPEYADYPLIMTAGHIPQFTHSTARNVPWVREIAPVPDLSINPVDAEKYGIETGDWVWVETKIGKTQGRALVTLAIPEGVVHMERWWFPETMTTETLGATEMNINMVTDDAGPFNDVIGSCTYRGFQVKVYKADSAPEGIWTEPKQFEVWLPDYEGAEVTDIHEIEGAAYNG